MSVPAFLHPNARPAAHDFLTIARGKGALVYDAEGTEYVDALASLWYCTVGHGRREVIGAITRQLRTLESFHAFDRFTNEPADRLAERVVGLSPHPDGRVHLTSSGSEAVDSAIKLARITHSLAGEPERTIIVSRIPSYHGVTYGGVSAIGMPAFQEHIGPLLPDLLQVPHEDLGALSDVLDHNPGRVAAVLVEPVIGAPGVFPAPEGYLAAVRELCDQHGALLIFDEVITGFGRLGSWFAAQAFGITPDLITFAKAVTSGYVPLGGVILSRRVCDVLESDPTYVLRHGHTYSGHSTACAAGLAVLDVVAGERLLDRAKVVGERLGAGLRALVDGDRVAEVRGAGAVFGVGLGEGLDPVAVRDAMLARGVIARPIGSSTVAFCPPLVISDDHVDRCVEVLAEAVETVRGFG